MRPNLIWSVLVAGALNPLHAAAAWPPRGLQRNGLD
jgi:hypothetical protein